MRENARKMRTRITPNTDTFYAVDTINYHENGDGNEKQITQIRRK